MKWSKIIPTILESAIGALIAFGVAYVCFRLIGTEDMSELKLASITTVVLGIAYLLSKIDYSQFTNQKTKSTNYYFDSEYSLSKNNGQKSSIDFMNDS